MITPTSLAPLLQRFFTQRLMQQRQASPHTISSYRDTFRQFLKFIQQRLGKPPSRLTFEEIDAPLIVAFLDELEKRQGISARSRNLRLTAIHSFFRYAAFEVPAYSAQIQRVLAIPSKRFTRTLVQFLTRPEVDALLAAPNQHTWSGRRDHAFLLVAVQTGLRLSEMTGLKCKDLIRREFPRLCRVGRKTLRIPGVFPRLLLWCCRSSLSNELHAVAVAFAFHRLRSGPFEGPATESLRLCRISANLFWRIPVLAICACEALPLSL